MIEKFRMRFTGGGELSHSAAVARPSRLYPWLMASESAGSAWTDERLDDFRGEVSAQFDRVDGRFEQVDGRFEQVDGRFERVDRRFDRVDIRFDRVDKRFDRMDERIDALHRTILTVGGGMTASILIGAAGIAATQI
jgi:hypothetical protein